MEEVRIDVIRLGTQGACSQHGMFSQFDMSNHEGFDLGKGKHIIGDKVI